MLSTEIQFIFQLGILIVFTRIGGYWLRRWLRLPGVLGELIVGMAIGPYALGRFHWPVVGQLFPFGPGGAPVSPELYAFSTFASIVLLFLSGLETDLRLLFRYSVAGTVIGLGGVIFSFAFGAGLCMMMADVGMMHPRALFLGILCTATSVGMCSSQPSSPT